MDAQLPDAVANLLRLAQQFQRENGGFLPFGELSQCGDRKYQAVGEEHLTGSEIISVLNDVYRDKAALGTVEWAALCSDVHVSDPHEHPSGTDAIRVDYEDQTGRSESFFMPYVERPEGTYGYGSIFARDKKVCWLTA